MRKSLKERIYEDYERSMKLGMETGCHIVTPISIPCDSVLEYLDEIHAMLWKLTNDGKS